MAKMHPPRFPYPKEPRRKAEAQFFRACDEQLSDEWTVLYEQHWFGHRNGKSQSGEADFIMLNPEFGVFVVEVKGGQEIGVENGEWYTVPRGSSTRERVKNPFTQAADSKFVLWQYIREKLPNVRLNGELGHFVVFPGHRQDGDISPQARRVLICDRDDLVNLEKTMARVSSQFSQKTNWSEPDIAQLVQTLMPSFELFGYHRPDLEEFTDQLELLTEIQLQTFAMLRVQRKLNVHGGAGTGKTVLALHRARELAAQGLRVLYLCHSAALAEFLRESLENRDFSPGNLVVMCERELLQPLHEQELGVRYELNDYVLDCIEDEAMAIDALIIDEAQCIGSDWSEPALARLVPDGRLYIFGDPDQTGNQRTKLFGKEDFDISVLEKLGMEDVVTLNVNCRSSVEIVEFSCTAIGSSMTTIGSRFTDVEVHECLPSNTGQAVEAVVTKWLVEFGVELEDIVLLKDLSFNSDLMDDEYWTSRFCDQSGIFEGNNLLIDFGNHFSFVPEETTRQFFERVPTLAKSESERQKQKQHWVESQFLSPDEELWFYRHLEIREDRLSAASSAIMTVVDSHDFIGLEAPGAIVLLPRFTTTSGSRDMLMKARQSVYTMATRAKSLLAVIGDRDSIRLLTEPFAE